MSRAASSQAGLSSLRPAATPTPHAAPATPPTPTPTPRATPKATPTPTPTPHGDFRATVDHIEAARPQTFAAVRDVLRASGWYITWYESQTYFGAHNPTTDETLSYCEGVVHLGDYRDDPAAYTAAYAPHYNPTRQKELSR